MWLKSLSFYLISSAPSPEKLSQALSARPFQQCTGMDWFSEGWVAPAPHLDSTVYNANGYLLTSLKREEKVLPTAVIRDALDKKITAIEREELRKVGRDEKLRLKEQITDDLLVRAFTRSTCTSTYFDLKRGWLVIDNASPQKAEAALSRLREATPPLPAAIPRTVTPPHTLMTDWLAAGEASGDFALDADAKLCDSSEKGAQISVKRMDLTAEEIRQHIAAGKQVTELGLIWRERIRFKLTDTLRIKKLEFLDVLREEANQAGDDAASLFEATFLLMSEEVGEMLTDLIDAMGGIAPPQQ